MRVASRTLFTFSFVLLATLAAPVFAQSAQPGPGAQDEQSPPPRLRERDRSEVRLQSRAGLDYRVMISTPRGAAPPDGFPVFYVLDGDAWFNSAVEAARVREWGRLSPSVVVGIGYPSGQFFDGPRRNFDFTPPGSSEPDFDAGELGGADAFLEFLNDVVKPWVGARHAIDARKETLFGHSMGGLFVLHAMYVSPHSFDVYLSASPPIRFSDRLLVREASRFEDQPGRRDVRALISVGELEQPAGAEQIDDYRRYFMANPAAAGGLNVEQALALLFPREPGFNKARELRRLAARLARSGGDIRFVEFSGEEHTPSALDALARGIAFALRPPRR
jgi:predicted alpha/beta superfamily hydrolase